jgi:glycosyltransferase involved in cell wall biosynthesis
LNVVIVAPCHVPLVIGGAEKLWWGLLQYLNGQTPHHADIIKLPGPERDFWEVVESYRHFSELDLRHYDAIISGKYPAWMSDHPRHVIYMLHPLRGLYDTYPPGLPPSCEVEHPDVRALVRLARSGEHSREALGECFERVERLRFPRRPRRFARRPVPPEVFAFPGPLIREIVHFCDGVAFRSGAIRRFCAISATVAGREGYFPPGTDVTPVYPPSDLTGYRRPRRGRHLLTVSRLDAPKRVDLLIEAMRYVRAPVELLVAGTGPDEQRLRELADGDPRIRFLGYVNDEALLDLYSQALAVLFAPVQEDFGLVALEAMAAGKAVVTTSDAGGPSELVEHGRTGYITDPEPQAIAAHVERLLADRRLARAMGTRGRARAAEVTWERVGAALLDGIDA